MEQLEVYLRLDLRLKLPSAVKKTGQQMITLAARNPME
jgi:hypothetical protein